MNQKYKNKVLLFPITICALFIIHCVLSYVLDPFQIFHKSYFGNYFLREQRYQNVGLINNYLTNSDFNSIIMGTCLTELITSKQIKNYFPKWNSLNFSMEASPVFDQNTVLKLALKKKKLIM
ncbi:hypothetical protein AAEX28_07380 [Lentisphaerota bacterium WC36G]|nr:hypothetical protein LJT99_10240 [Lentisphaerae bacterium WC36]